MHPFFQHNPVRASAASFLESDARLALHLFLFLVSTQNRDDGTWRGFHIGATLRATCHALEALHLIGRETCPAAMAAGVSWLLNLPDISGFISEEEEDVVRLHPSRFKTLAWLGEFANPRARKDFEELEEHLDEEGMLRDIMPKQFLATMVYVDCLDHLEKHGCLSVLSAERRERALNCIQRNMLLWHQNLQQKTRYSYIESAGDLSYAMDLLVRADLLSKQADITKDISRVLVSALEHPERQRPVPSDTLYCGIQLATHFPEIVEAKEAVRTLISHLRTRYEKLDLKKESAFFHPLVLRLLLAYHGNQLTAEIMRLLVEHERESLELQSQSAEQSLKDDFGTIIKRQFDVDISDVVPLTGGITRADVFRVHFSLKLASIGEGGAIRVDTYHPSHGSLVIKTGSADSLRRSIWRYRSLPDAVKPFFATHSEDLQVLQATPSAPSYLVMEDVGYMDTFRDIFAGIDQGSLSRSQEKDLERACDTICAGLFAVYDQTRRGRSDFCGAQLSRLYISDLEKNLIRMCRPDKFPHLKPWLRGFWLGQKKYPSIEFYLGKLESHEARLKVPHLMLVHGDCHSRNIMLDGQLRRLKLIDLDNLDYDGDYIRDLALLIEDVSAFRFLFDEGYRFHLTTDQICFLSGSSDPRVIENKIQYPSFSSEGARLFQRYLLQRLETYARAIHDECWKERLWLASAASLMFLVSKQIEKEFATVVYVEAVKLLDELVTCLENESPLGDIVFPGEHPVGVTKEPEIGDMALPLWYQSDSTLASVHDGIMRLGAAMRYELASSGRIAQYFAGDLQFPLAVIDTKKQPPCLFLACPSQVLDDPEGVIQKRQTQSVLQSVIWFAGSVRASAVLSLIQQALEFYQRRPN